MDSGKLPRASRLKSAMAVMLVAAACLPGLSFAETVGEATREAGHDVASAARTVKHGVKHAAKRTGHGIRHAAHSVKHGVKRAVKGDSSTASPPPP